MSGHLRDGQKKQHEVEKAMGLEPRRRCIGPKEQQSLLELRPPIARNGSTRQESLEGRAPLAIAA
jgi:hypothetical protein